MPQGSEEPAAPRKRGTAVAEVARPERFPHRIWAACDFESRLPDYGWFGQAETKNVPDYPGHVMALKANAKPYGKVSARMAGINPVPGPRMGKANYMYCRYFLRGATEATFQHFSLSVNDNSHIRVSGLTEGKWAEVTLNFTRDAKRNDGSADAFQEGERMDDLKVFVGKPDDGKEYELLLDDVIFFSDAPDLPPEKEPFPNRVIYLAAFDTGIAPGDKEKYWPGELEIVAKDLPPDSYWGVAKAVARKDGKGKWIRLKSEPPKPVGARTKLRFRYHLSGASAMTVQIFDLTDNDNRHIRMKDLKQNEWATANLDFTNGAKRNDGGKTPFAAGHKVDDIFFLLPPGENGDLLIDEVVLYDAGAPLAEKRGP